MTVLQPGDVVRTSKIKRLGIYAEFTVLTATPPNETNHQTVTASAPGFGSTRFTWSCSKETFARGFDNGGLYYYFVRYGIPEGWTNPKDAPWGVWGEVILRNGEVREAHRAQDLSGEEQPPYRGWFVAASVGHHYQIEDPVGWRPRQGAPL